ncbi:extracellular solute-binding protein [Paenibacillus alginolyticus]|uniref:Extracellular solute-binding protein n=1 Tax=Paenibacillus alginolyticus TaxID=59839 RepID=A0ABT4GII1_9BACL|nr:extracellular solute-binding protein [Paenibacillus alginolyticus]MCY9695931.1 extracellular solute-binding protein [Paenibacillus alginolyticus]MEC0146784.1 extracellular solute-binding protein [Paenibacillus alginolyticus]
MKKKITLISMMALFVLMTACSSGGASKDGVKQAADPNVKVDPFKMPNPIEVTTFKSLSPGAKLPAGDTVESNQYMKYISEKTNINFKILWYAASQDYDQKMKLAIASNDLPDVMLVNEQIFLSLAEAGQIEDLSKVYDKYASPLAKELYASTNNKAIEKATYKGKLMGIPNISVQADAASMAWVRKDWMDKLGLQPPKSIDDVAAIAKAFAEKDPDGNGKADTIGIAGFEKALTVSGKAQRGDFKGIFQAFGAYPSNWIKDSSGKAVYASILPETKQALGKLRDMYAAGAIDKEFALRKDPNENIVSGKAGMFFGPWWSGGLVADALKLNPKVDFVPYLIPDAKGTVNTMMVPVSTQFIVVKKGMKNPEAAMIYANTFINAQRKVDPDALKLDFTVSAEYWPIGNSTYDYADAVERKSDTLKKAMGGQIKPEELNPEMKELLAKATRDKANPKADLKDWSGYYGYTVPADLLKMNMNKVYSEFTANTKTMERKWVNLQKLENETFFGIVMGEKPFDSFDKFVTDWKAQGGDEITKEVMDEISKSKK